MDKIIIETDIIETKIDICISILYITVVSERNKTSKKEYIVQDFNESYIDAYNRATKRALDISLEIDLDL